MIQKNKITERNFDDMQDYFTAIIKISESGNEETLKAIRRIAIDASNYFSDNFAPVNEIKGGQE